MSDKINHTDVLEMLVEACKAYVVFTVRDSRKSSTLVDMLANGHHPRIVVDLGKSLTIEMFQARDDGKGDPVSLFQVHAGQENSSSLSH